jgi:hypothetical protein
VVIAYDVSEPEPCGVVRVESFRSGSDVVGTPRATPNLSVERVMALHVALRNEIADRNPISSPDLREALRQICGEAKLKNWQPEQLLVAFKMALDTVPAVRRIPRGPERHEFVARLVSLCIDEYYGAPRR